MPSCSVAPSKTKWLVTWTALGRHAQEMPEPWRQGRLCQAVFDLWNPWNPGLDHTTALFAVVFATSCGHVKMCSDLLLYGSDAVNVTFHNDRFVLNRWVHVFFVLAVIIWSLSNILMTTKKCVQLPLMSVWYSVHLLLSALCFASGYYVMDIICIPISTISTQAIITLFLSSDLKFKFLCYGCVKFSMNCDLTLTC